MAKSLPPLTWFRAFEAAARHLSFTMAAEELGFTQSAISQHVRSLEDRLGSQLFVRGNRSLHLTEAGRLLVPDVAAAIAQLQNATHRFIPATGKPKLTIATSASVAHWVIAPHLAGFHARHPDIAVQLVTTVWPDDFSTTTADIEIRFGSREVVGRQADLLEPSFVHLVAAPDVAARLPEICRLQDLAEFPLIQPVGLSTSWAILGRQGKPPVTLEAASYVDTHGLAVELAIAGAGIAMAHCQITRGPLGQGRLVALDFDAIPAREGYYFGLQSTSHPKEQAAFANWFRDLVAQGEGTG